MNLVSNGLLIAAEGSSAHSNPLIPETNELIWGAVSFFVLLALLSKIAFPKMNAMLVDRRAQIEGKLEQAERDRRDAESLRRQYEQKMDDAGADAQRTLDKAKANADRLEAELRAQAEEKARRIVERAQESIATERARAVRGLRTQVGDLVVDLSSRVIGESLDRERHLRLVDQYIAELQTASGRGASTN